MTYEYIELNIIGGKFNIDNKEFIVPNYNKVNKSFSANMFKDYRFRTEQLYLLGKYKNKLYFILEEYSDDYGNIPIWIFNEEFDIVDSFTLLSDDSITYFDDKNGCIITTDKIYKLFFYENKKIEKIIFYIK